MTNICGQVPNSGPDGPTGVIVLKKIADETYEQYGSIEFGTQVTFSGSIDPGIGSIETTVTLREDFHSRVNLTATDSVWSFPSGAWGMPTPIGAISTFATIVGAVRIEGTGAANASLSYSRDEISFSQKTNSNVNRNPTYQVGWASFGGSASTRSIGWADAALASASNNGLYWRQTTGGFITAVARSGGSESTLTSTTIAITGVWNYGTMVVSEHGAAVACALNGADVGILSTNIPTVDLFPSAGTSSIAANTGLDVDYFAMTQNRTVV